MKTLLISVHPQTRQLLCETLQRRGHKVTVVADADAACAAIQSGRFGLVIIETDGPDGEGVLLCRRLRAISQDGHCLILAAARALRPEEVEALLAAGADDCLTDLDDPQRLEVRLSVTEHRVRATTGRSPGVAPSQDMPIDCCPLLYHAPYGVFRCTLEGKFLEVNPALTTMLGYDSDEDLLAADTPREICDDPTHRRTAIAQMVERGYAEGTELYWKRRDGTSLTVLFFGRTACDDTGSAVRIEGIIHDITEQKRTQEALQESEQRFRAVFDHAADGILVADVETGQFCAGNRAICGMLGYSQEEIRELRVKDVHPEEDLPYVMQRFEEQVRQEQALATDIPVRRKDGSVFYADISSFPITLAGRTHLAGIFRDITERKQTEETLRQNEERLRRVLENMPVMLDAFDADGRVVAWNQECERVTGYRAAEIVGNPQAMQWLYPDEAYREQMLEAWRQRGNDYRGWEWEITCKDGSIRIVAWSNISKHFPVCGWATWGIGVDVTEAKETIRRLHDSEARYRLIADNVSDMIWMGTLEGLADFENRAEKGDLAQISEELMRRWQFTYVSPSVERLLGYNADQALSLKFEAILPPDSYFDAMKVLLEELMAERQQPGQRRERTLEVKHRIRDGSLRDVEVTTTFWRDAEGRPIGLLGVTRDITRRKQAEEAVRKSEVKLRSLIENIPDFVLIVDQQGTICFANRTSPEWSMEEVTGANGLQYVAPEHLSETRRALELAFERQEVQSLLCQDVVGRWYETRIVPMVEEGGVLSAMAICTDVTQRRKADQAIQKEQQLLRQLLDLHERDRQLTAYEIHDGFSQYLTGALYNLQGFRELQAKQPQEAWATFDAGLSLICRSINEARRLIGGLRPPVLDESGIVAAVDYLACETEESGETEVEFVHDVKFGRLASPLESAIFRIVQESLTNARRHSRSAKIRIELRQADNHIQIDVRDWGIGFDLTKVEEGRFGLRGIRERARLFGGQVSIETAPHQGTRISVELPLVERAGEPAAP